MAFPVIQITYESSGICRQILAWGRYSFQVGFEKENRTSWGDRGGEI